MSKQMNDSQVSSKETIYSPDELVKTARWTRTPTPQMLKGKGVILTATSSLSVDNYASLRRPLRVRYDKTYVIEKLAREMRLLAKELSLPEWEKLMYEVYLKGLSSQQE